MFSLAMRKLEGITELPAYEAEHADRQLHLWHNVDLPKGWATFFGSGKLKIVWKDHGYGRAKGHIWVRIFPSETAYSMPCEQAETVAWLKLTTRVAGHYWRTELLELPDKLFEEQHSRPGVLQFAAESHYSDDRVGYDMTGYEVHIADASKLLMCRRFQEDRPVPEEMSLIQGTTPEEAHFENPFAARVNA